MNRFSLLSEDEKFAENFSKECEEKSKEKLQPLLSLCIVKDDKTQCLTTTMKDGKKYTLSPCGMKINDNFINKGIYVGSFSHRNKKKASEKLQNCLSIFSPYLNIADIGNFFILTTLERENQPLLNMEDVMFLIKNYLSIGSLVYKVEWQKQ